MKTSSPGIATLERPQRMAAQQGVSAIISTFNRRELVTRAIDSVLAQTRPVDEIIVIDDGSTDGTGQALAARFGDRLRYRWQPNAGVSSARNHGMAMANGAYFALLDSDDVWMPEKTALQLCWLERNPGYGMVLCDIEWIRPSDGRVFVMRRRDAIREDGWVLPWVLQGPSLIPASTLLRREVVDDIGGFDESLRTAEDLDFHLRIARRWRIGVVEKPLVSVTRNHDGLSSLPQTCDDYVDVMERTCAESRDVVEDDIVRRALSIAYARNARGMIIAARWRDALRLGIKAWRASPGPRSARNVLALAGFGLKCAIRRSLPY